ncbi:MAG: ECF-type sigma factor [Bacteroidota bacterium]
MPTIFLAAPDPDPTVDPLSAAYDDLRAIARRMRRRERPGLTIQTTGLVHEAVLALEGSRRAGADVSPALYARAMRNVLVSHARRRLTAKRGAGAEVLPLDEDLVASGVEPGEAWAQTLLDVDRAMAALQGVSPRLHRVVELRFFGGFSVAEASEVLGTGTATVKRDWAKASAWLRCYLRDHG